MRVLRPILGGLVVLALTASGVLAGGKPTREFFQNPAQFLYAAGEACAFPVQVDTLLQAEYGITFYDAAGDPIRTLVSGRLIVQLTNLTTGASVTLNVSGPAEFVYNADGTISATLRGPSILIPPGVPLYDHAGPLHLLIGTDGVPALIGQEGFGIDGCSLID